LLDPAVELSVAATAPQGAEFSILVGGVPSAADLGASEKLTTLVIPWAGLPHPTAELLKSHPAVRVHNVHHNADATAEMALALALAAAKRLIPIDRGLRAGDWRPRYEDSSLISLAGKTALVIGFGAVGRRIAEIARALKMNVWALNRSGEAANAGDIPVSSIDSLLERLPDTQCLFIAAPYTPETADLINEKALRALPDGALVVNVARGRIVNERALYDELKSGRLRAGLDVWYNYPKKPEEYAHTPPSEFPFGELDNVVMMPHMGGDSLDIEHLRAVALAELLNAAARGEEMPNRVDLQRGY
ncbi:MAG TPA: NAD(P)-dependent oxidoreductase, partial [candidate division Zixibacteria bacterium]|nr:NAD(P)-dependent oxidoreductase [candidate division Zixibacteria bacterium]